ncbi:MAG: hypothetical protein M3Q36_00525 [bacterium]|nr:hypothetical protein [bacterium]
MISVNKLHNIEAFKTVLKNYKPSDEGVKMLQALKLVLLIGPSAAGRNTMISILRSTGRYHYIVSDTTRLPRENNGIMEQNGVEYWFKPEEKFLDGLQKGAYLEAAIIHGQQVSGISIAELNKANLDDKIAIDEIEVDGADHIHNYKPDALFVFLLPPNFDIWMQRLMARGYMDEQEIRRRLISARTEISTALQANFYQFVINNEIHEAAEAVDQLVSGRPPDQAKQTFGRSHAKKLIEEIEYYLNIV